MNLLADDHIWCLRCVVFGVVMNDGLYCYLHSHLVAAVMHCCWKVPIRFRCDFERVAPIRPAQNMFHTNHNAVRLYFQTMNLTATHNQHIIRRVNRLEIYVIPISLHKIALEKRNEKKRIQLLRMYWTEVSMGLCACDPWHCVLIHWNRQIDCIWPHLDVFPFFWYAVRGLRMTLDMSHPIGWNGKCFTTQFTT